MNTKFLFAVATASLVACSADATPEQSPMAESVPPPIPAASSEQSSSPAPAPAPSPEQPADPQKPVDPGPIAFYSIDGDNQLTRFETNDLANPTTIAITGLEPNETISTIDVRSSDKTLWGIGTFSRMYKIDPATGVASNQSGVFLNPLQGTLFEMDYDSSSDRFRIATDEGQNYLFNPTTNALVWPFDAKLGFSDADLNKGKKPAIGGIAYGVKQSSAWGIDPEMDALVLYSDPSKGLLTTVGSLGVDIGGQLGFDIVEVNGKDVAYLLAHPPLIKASNLYTVDLGTGKATLVGTVGGLGLHGLVHPL